MIENIAHDVNLSRQRQGGIVIKGACQSPEQLAVQNRKLNFDEVEKCLNTELALKEAERCLRCYRVMLMAVNSEK